METKKLYRFHNESVSKDIYVDAGGTLVSAVGHENIGDDIAADVAAFFGGEIRDIDYYDMIPKDCADDIVQSWIDRPIIQQMLKTAIKRSDARCAGEDPDEAPPIETTTQDEPTAEKRKKKKRKEGKKKMKKSYTKSTKSTPKTSSSSKKSSKSTAKSKAKKPSKSSSKSKKFFAKKTTKSSKK